MPQLPFPVTEKSQHTKQPVHSSLYILNWIFFSNITILFNKWLIDTAGFKYPIILTAWHLIFATLATQILAYTTTLLDSRKSLPITGRLYLRTIVPIGFLYSGSLVCSNLVYLYLSVAFIQMLKAAAPVAVLLCSWAWGVASPSRSNFLNVLVIVLGVAMASAGEIEFSIVGFVFQLGGIGFEAMRLIMIQVMLSDEGMKMDPLVGLYYYAPVCAVLNILIAWVSEVPRFQWEDLQHTGIPVLVLNAAVAFMLNIASVFLIGKTSGLVMTLTGIFKNILLVIVSVMIWKTHITSLQVLGYAVALCGLVYYSLGYDQLLALSQASGAWASDFWNSSSANAKLPINVRRGVAVCIMIVVSTVMLVAMFGDNHITANTVSTISSWFGTE